MAAKLDVAPLPSFNQHSEANNLASRWKNLTKRFQTVIKVANISSKTQQRALLLYQAGPVVQVIFETLVLNWLTPTIRNRVYDELSVNHKHRITSPNFTAE